MNELVAKARKELVTEIVDELKSGKFFLWDNPNYSRSFMNYATGSKYRGGNIFALMLKPHRMGYTDNRWVTNKQAKDMGLIYKDYKDSSRTGIEHWRKVTAYYDEDGKLIPEKDVKSGKATPASQKSFLNCRRMTEHTRFSL